MLRVNCVVVAVESGVAERSNGARRKKTGSLCSLNYDWKIMR